MSATITRIPLAEAREIADELVDLLQGACSRIEVCGSIRRQKPLIGDIDIIAVPKLDEVRDPMFDLPTGTPRDLLHEALEALYMGGLVERGRRSDGALAGWGPRLKKLAFKGMSVQVQAVDAEVWGTWLVIRTGPGAYSQAFVTPVGQRAALRRGSEVVGYRPGTLPPGFNFGGSFRLYRDGVFVPTPEERTVYEVLGLPYLPPEQRR